MLYDPVSTIRATAYRVVFDGIFSTLQSCADIVHLIDTDTNTVQIYTDNIVENEREIVTVPLKNVKVLNFSNQSIIFILEFDENHAEINKL